MDVKVLVVEDEAITAMDIKSRLEKLGYSVPSIAMTGEEAIALTESIKPDLILMDIVLKGKMDGTEAAKIISANFNIPVVFLTAYNDSDTFARAKDVVPQGYLTKPFETRDLRNAVELALFRHQMELKVALAEMRYHTLLENASCGIIVYDKNGQIFELNKAAEVILGYKKEHVLGMDFRQIFPPEEREYLSLQLQKLAIEKKIGPSETTVVHADKKNRQVEFSSVSIELDGATYFMMILTDRTELHRLRKQTVLSDKLATLGSLAAGMVHEINNPLMWIIANLSNLNEILKIPPHTETEREQLIETLSQEVGLLLEGVEQIRDIVAYLKNFSRVNDAEIVPMDIHAVLNNVLRIAGPHLKNHIKVETEYTGPIPNFLSNRGRLQQVFLNIVVNAIQALQNSRSESVIKIKTHLKKDMIHVYISDTGEGILPEVLPKIFDPFFTTKPTGIGTGLGLSISKEIMDAMHGSLRVTSTMGKGTTFHICIPFILEYKDSETSIDKLLTAFDSQRFLMIDDDPTVLNILKRMLEKTHEIVLAYNGREALALLTKKDNKFDVIITDINMPEINGMDLYRYLSKSSPGEELKMIFTTGGVFSTFTQEFLQVTANPCLEKPFTQEQLFKAIHKILIKTKPKAVI